MMKCLERIGFITAAALVLFILGWFSTVNPDISLQANPMKVNQEQLDRIHEAANYVYKRK